MPHLEPEILAADSRNLKFQKLFLWNLHQSFRAVASQLEVIKLWAIGMSHAMSVALYILCFSFCCHGHEILRGSVECLLKLILLVRALVVKTTSVGRCRSHDN